MASQGQQKASRKSKKTKKLKKQRSGPMGGGRWEGDPHWPGSLFFLLFFIIVPIFSKLFADQSMVGWLAGCFLYFLEAFCWPGHGWYILYTIYYILYTIYSTIYHIPYAIYYMLYTIYYFLNTKYYILYIIYYMLCTIYYIL